MTVHIHEARKLEKKGMFGKADPYVLITLGQAKTKTKTISNNQNPSWNFVAKIGVDNPAETDKMLLEIFDDDIGKDDALGVVSINIIDIYRGSPIIKQWYPLEKCKSGDICVSLSFSNEPLVIGDGILA